MLQIIGAIRGEAKARVPVIVTMGNIWPPRTCADRAAAVKNEMSNVCCFHGISFAFCAFLDTTKNIFTSPMVLRCADWLPHNLSQRYQSNHHFKIPQSTLFCPRKAN